MIDSARGVHRSALEQFRIGIGPSSSHTVGPMRAAQDFAERLRAVPVPVARVRVRLLGSLGATGIGHGTPDAVVAGLRGLDPQTCDPDDVRGSWAALGSGGSVALLGGRPIVVSQQQIRLNPLIRRPEHANAIRLLAWDVDRQLLRDQQYFSVGGGFVVDGPAFGPGGAPIDVGSPTDTASAAVVPHRFGSAKDLLYCRRIVAARINRFPDQRCLAETSQ